MNSKSPRVAINHAPIAGFLVYVLVSLIGPDSAVIAQEMTDTTAKTTVVSWWQPKATDSLQWQLQLQGDVVVIPGVDVYAVDATASKKSIDAAKGAGAKLMCYISAGSAEQWREDFKNFPRTVVGKPYDGWPGEWWLDTGSIEALAPIMRARMDVCKAKGFDVLDADNINGFENDTGFDITRLESIRYILWLADEAHDRGMSFSLKNAETLIPDLLDSIDMMQSESCFVYGNCVAASLMTAVNKPVFAVEYQENIDAERFKRDACAIAGSYKFSMIYRDRLLKPEGVYLNCGGF